MSSWRECKLGDVVSSNNKTVDKNYEFENIQYLDTGSLTNNKIDSFQEFKINEAPSRAKRLVKHQDIVYSTVRPIQRHFGFIENPQENLVVSTGFSVIETNQKLAYPKFIYYFLSSDETVEILDVIAEASTSAYPSLKPSDIKNLDISLPPLAEQKAIAEVLSRLDDKIDLLHRQNQTLESLAQTLFRQWFIEEAKEEWKEKPLGELLTITSSKRIFYSEYVDSGVPFYRSKEIIELHNTGSTKSELYITEERLNEIIQKFGAPQEGDILLTSVGTLGIPYRVNADDRFYFKDGNLTWFKDFTIISSIIIFYWLKSDIGKEQLDSITIGSTQSALTISGLKEIKLPIPPKEIIERLTYELNSFDEKISQNMKQIQTLENLRDTLLPKLLSGEVRVKFD